MDGTLAATDSWFRQPASKVSAHYGIGSAGEIHQYVGEGDTAWHAGRVYKSSWALLKRGVDPNLYTIGVEHEGSEDSSWSDEMFNASVNLVAEICNRWSIQTDRSHLVGHREIYARKSCPGDWLDLVQFASRVATAVVQPSIYNFYAQPGSVDARVDLNLRSGSPTTASPVVRVAPAGTGLRYVGWTSNGLTVNGNAHWYKTEDGEYFWAGATSRPTPGV